MRPPRGLTGAEAELWARVAQTVAPLAGKTRPALVPVAAAAAALLPKAVKPRPAPPLSTVRAAPRPAVRPLDGPGLDGTWERRLARAAIAPDFTLDLHGHNLEAAHARLDMGLTQAVAQGARLVLVITGLPRPVDAADRGSRRGAIRAKLLDWLAAGPHASRIAAVRPAHQKHGGAGALYVVLRRLR